VDLSEELGQQEHVFTFGHKLIFEASYFTTRLQFFLQAEALVLE
jgi:hypothetical protein